METHILNDARQLGEAAAQRAALTLNTAIDENGGARLVVSTGRPSSRRSMLSSDKTWTGRRLRCST